MKYFKEDRWGSCECTLCGVRLKNESCFRAHCETSLHVENLGKQKAAELADVEGSSDDPSALASSSNNTRGGTRTKTVFLLDPFAHHSSSLPFREMAAKFGSEYCECVELTTESAVFDTHAFETELLEKVVPSLLSYSRHVVEEGDIKDLEEQNIEHVRLEFYAVLCAGSNVTGVLRNVPYLTQQLHKKLNVNGHSCFVAWDFAASMAHQKIDLNPRNFADAEVDAAFFSPHKLLGGPGSSGVLVMKKRLLRSNTVPTTPGGGTVFYVSDAGQSYIQNHEEREEAGTPNILADIRAGMAFKIHHAMAGDGASSSSSALQLDEPVCGMEAREERLRQRLLARLEKMQNLELLASGEGADVGGKAAIFSFLIRHGERYLHYNFVCAILNDLFGIQARGGCACAGPYAQKLLGMSTAVSNHFDSALKRYGTEVIRPGFVRLSLHYLMRDEEVDWLADCLAWVASDGWRLLPAYTFDVETGEWEHEDDDHQGCRKWLGDMDLFTNSTTSASETPILDLAVASKLKDSKKKFLNEVTTRALRIPAKNRSWPILDERVAPLLWFSLPQDVASGTHAKRNAAVSGGLIFGNADVSRPERSCFRIGRPPGAGALLDVQAEGLVGTGTGTEGQEITSSETCVLSSQVHQLGKECDVKRKDGSSTPTTTGSADEDALTDDLLADMMQHDVEDDEVEVLEGRTVPEENSSTTPRAVLKDDKEQLDNKQEFLDDERRRAAPDGGASSSTSLAPTSTSLVREVNGRLIQRYATTALYPKVPKTLRASVGQAIKDFGMIQPGDRLLIGLSGGKDSLTLLHTLMCIQKCSPVSFSIACATVNPMTPEYDPSPLKEYLKALNVEYHFLSKPLIEMAKELMNPKKPSICSFCARMKRGMLYSCMRDNGYNVLVLGQHLDDMAESFLMSAFYNGALRTMKANYAIQADEEIPMTNEGGEAGAKNDQLDPQVDRDTTTSRSSATTTTGATPVVEAGCASSSVVVPARRKIRVIRPLVYVREKIMAQFAAENRLPVISDNCPACFAVPKERHRIKLLLAKEEFQLHDLFSNLLKCMRPLIAIDHAKIEDDKWVVRNVVPTKDGGRAGQQQANTHNVRTTPSTIGISGSSSSQVEISGKTARGEDEEAELALTSCGIRGGKCS
ncbi:unnamed protein product [Amoebophrya sp. A25]|nr:unnamed protein product [Amoebophrya sp. A25]|eukprot:GSA25T00011193001.1